MLKDNINRIQIQTPHLEVMLDLHLALLCEDYEEPNAHLLIILWKKRVQKSYSV